MEKPRPVTLTKYLMGWSKDFWANEICLFYGKKKSLFKVQMILHNVVLDLVHY